MTEKKEGMDQDEVMRVLRAFEAAGVEYVLVGAAAMAFHGVVRATENIEFFLSSQADNVEKLRNALRVVYASDPYLDQLSAADLLGKYKVVRYYPPTRRVYFDFLLSFETIEAESREVDGTQVRYATRSALHDLKTRSGDLQDQVDAASLRDHVGETTTAKRVQKFCSIEEMNRAPIPESREPGSNFERFIRHCARWWAIAPKTYPRGVFKFRSLEEAQKAREKYK